MLSCQIPDLHYPPSHPRFAPEVIWGLAFHAKMNLAFELHVLLIQLGSALFEIPDVPEKSVVGSAEIKFFPVLSHIRKNRKIELIL